MAQLAPAEVRVAPAQAAQRTEHPAKGDAELGQLLAPLRSGLGGALLDGSGCSSAAPYAPIGSAFVSALALIPRRRARGFSARSSTTHGTSAHTAIPNDHQ